jgi:hypothetical protein
MKTDYSFLSDEYLKSCNEEMRNFIAKEDSRLTKKYEEKRFELLKNNIK